MITISNLTIIVLLILPLLFQLIFGSKATAQTCSIKFWKICLISVLAQVLATVLNVFLMTESLKHSGSRDGLPIAGILIVEAVIGSIMLVMILIQLFIMYRRKIKL